jgi:hypothetical protein
MNIFRKRLSLCFSSREKRYDIDLVHDDVQKDLIMEISAMQGAVALLTRTIEQTKEQLR